MTLETSRPLSRLRWSSGQQSAEGVRYVAEEMPIAIVHDGSTTAVMMATPADLEDFALGFSLSEGIIATLDEVVEVSIVAGDIGVEVRVWLARECSGRLAARRRRIVGPTGCGLCGIESLAEAMIPARAVPERPFAVTAEDLLSAMTALNRSQTLGRETRAVHAAGVWLGGDQVLTREDVGRHNALDKVAGAVARQSLTHVDVVLLTSRVSVEMVQKTARMGAMILCAVSAPTTLAIRVAEQAGLTLVGVAREDGFEVFTRPDRIKV